MYWLDYIFNYFIYLTIFVAHALKEIRWRSLLLLFRYLGVNETNTVI